LDLLLRPAFARTIVFLILVVFVASQSRLAPGAFLFHHGGFKDVLFVFLTGGVALPFLTTEGFMTGTSSSCSSRKGNGFLHLGQVIF
jgi:hypothetical protein